MGFSYKTHENQVARTFDEEKINFSFFSEKELPI